MTWWWSFVSKEITTRRKAAPKPTPSPTRCQGTFDFGAWTMWIWDQDGKDLADCPAMSFVSVCWHSRKWEPPIRGGLLQLALLRLENVKWTDLFCKKCISYTYCWWKSKKRDEKLTKTLKKAVFSSPFGHLAEFDLIWSRPYQVKLSQMAEGARKNSFFSGF